MRGLSLDRRSIDPLSFRGGLRLCVVRHRQQFSHGVALSGRLAESPDIVAKANDLLDKPQVRDALVKEIEGKLDDLIPVYVGSDLADGEVSGHELDGEITIDDFNVLAASDQSISVLLRVTIPLKITIDYEDLAYAFYDKEDARYYRGRSGRGRNRERASYSRL